MFEEPDSPETPNRDRTMEKGKFKEGTKPRFGGLEADVICQPYYMANKDHLWPWVVVQVRRCSPDNGDVEYRAKAQLIRCIGRLDKRLPQQPWGDPRHDTFLTESEYSGWEEAHPRVKEYPRSEYKSRKDFVYFEFDGKQNGVDPATGQPIFNPELKIANIDKDTMFYVKVTVLAFRNGEQINKTVRDAVTEVFTVVKDMKIKRNRNRTGIKRKKKLKRRVTD